MPFGQREGLRSLPDIGAGVVDQDIGPPEPRDGSLHHGFACRLVGDIDGDCHGLGTEIRQDGNGLIAFGRIPPSHDDGCASLRQGLGHGEADTAIAAGDDGNAPLEVELFHGGLIRPDESAACGRARLPAAPVGSPAWPATPCSGSAAAGTP